jgi:phosphate transport system permease protein
MTVVATAARPSISSSTIARRRRVTNRVATCFVWVAVAAAFVPLLVVLGFVVSKGAGVMSLHFLIDDIPQSARRAGGGMGPAIVGTLLVTLAASVAAIPLGILAAVHVHEYGGRGRLASIVRFLADVMAGVPSIVMGLFVYAIFVLPRKQEGASGLAASIALGCLMLPIVIRSTETMLKLVPDDLRNAAYALGTRKSRVILTVVLPAALPGITSGALLAVARAAGETAPLIFTIGGGNTTTNLSLDGQNNALALQIFSNATSAFTPAVDRAWGAALTLIALVVTLSLIARAIAARFTVR